MEVPMTDGERDRLAQTIARVNRIRAFLCQGPPPGGDVGRWFEYLSALKSLQGNANNDLSFLACVLAKRCLVERHGQLTLDVAAKAQGAAGLDIDLMTGDERRIVGEVKTVEPYAPSDFGAAQRKSFRDDFAKLTRANAAFKYMFVTSPRAHRLLESKYAREIPGVEVVLLTVEEGLAV